MKLSPGQQQCVRHGVVYTALSPCAKCEDDPAPSPAVEDASIADRQDLADEQHCRDQAERIREIAQAYQTHREEMGSQDSHGVNSLVKLHECEQKWLRLAREIRASYQQIEHDRDLVENARKLLGRFGGEGVH